MSKYIEDQIPEIEFFQLIHNLRERPALDLDEAARRYVEEGYAERYSKIWYKGINKSELRNKLFYGYVN